MDTKGHLQVEVEGEDKEFVVRTPSLHDQREAQKVYNQAFHGCY